MCVLYLCIKVSISTSAEENTTECGDYGTGCQERSAISAYTKRRAKWCSSDSTTPARLHCCTCSRRTEWRSRCRRCTRRARSSLSRASHSSHSISAATSRRAASGRPTSPQSTASSLWSTRTTATGIKLLRAYALLYCTINVLYSPSALNSVRIEPISVLLSLSLSY